MPRPNVDPPPWGVISALNNHVNTLKNRHSRETISSHGICMYERSCDFSFISGLKQFDAGEDIDAVGIAIGSDLNDLVGITARASRRDH
jgi:hypothetical protein